MLFRSVPGVNASTGPATRLFFAAVFSARSLDGRKKDAANQTTSASAARPSPIQSQDKKSLRGALISEFVFTLVFFAIYFSFSGDSRRCSGLLCVLCALCERHGFVCSAFKTWSSGPSLSRHSGVRGLWLCRKNKILAQRRRGAEKIKTRISSHYRAKTTSRSFGF